jgi:hypothetical protein
MYIYVCAREHKNNLFGQVIKCWCKHFRVPKQIRMTKRFLYTSLSNLVTQWTQFCSLPRPKWISCPEAHLLKQTGAYIRHGPAVESPNFAMASYAVTRRTASRRNWKYVRRALQGTRLGGIFYCFFANCLLCLFPWLNFQL